VRYFRFFPRTSAFFRVLPLYALAGLASTMAKNDQQNVVKPMKQFKSGGVYSLDLTTPSRF
jgi:hypothetical protein